MQSLVGTVRAGLRIVHAGDEDLRLREQLREIEQERDAPAGADVDGLRAPRLRKRRVHRAVCGTTGLGRERLADRVTLDADLRAPGHVLLEMLHQRVERLRRILTRRDAPAPLPPRARPERIP